MWFIQTGTIQQTVLLHVTNYFIDNENTIKIGAVGIFKGDSKWKKIGQHEIRTHDRFNFHPRFLSLSLQDLFKGTILRAIVSLKHFYSIVSIFRRLMTMIALNSEKLHILDQNVLIVNGI